jgi:hypothetical protein
MDRYRVTLKPDGRTYGILDRDRYEYCALVDKDGRRHPLEWKLREGADDWLKLCYRYWRAWEGTKARGQVPLRWRPLPRQTSPFDPGAKFYK